MNKNFNVRVYGLLINQNNEILMSYEEQAGLQFTKFPGGGLEYGEGLVDGLKREFSEECALNIEIISHFYTTHYFVKSAFNATQLIAVYYLVKPIGDFNLPTSKNSSVFFNPNGDNKQAFRWLKLKSLTENDVTFTVDKYVVKLLNNLG